MEAELYVHGQRVGNFVAYGAPAIGAMTDVIMLSTDSCMCACSMDGLEFENLILASGRLPPRFARLRRNRRAAWLARPRRPR